MKRFHELTIHGIMKKEISFKNMNEELSKAINLCFLNNKGLKELHEKNTFKFYSFSGLCPISKEGYKKGEEYCFKFRTMDKIFAHDMKSLLRTTNNELMDITTIELKDVTIGRIKQLYTMTPAICVIENKNHWIKDNHEIEKIIERINMNIQKKYKLWNNKDIDTTHNMIEDIQQQNKKVIVLDYKGGKLLANKFQIKVKGDPLSQELAFMILATGLLEKNSLGFGFCSAR